MSWKDNRYNQRSSRSKKHYQQCERNGKPINKKKSEMRNSHSRPAEDRGGSRSFYRDIAEDTVNQTENLPKTINAIKNTKTYTKSIPLYNNASSVIEDINIEIWECSSLDAAYDLVGSEGKKCCVLNFASAKNPGGGFLKGSNAQEESICRVTNLYHCIKDNEMYIINNQNNNNYLYHNMAIYTPKVLVVKDDDGNMLEEKYYIDVITCPAVNAGHSMDAVGPTKTFDAMDERVDLIISIAAKYKPDSLVLGSWGCGVFGGNLRDVGKLFKDKLEKYSSQLKNTTVVFAILSQTDEKILKYIFR